MRGHRKKEKESEYEKGKSCVEKEDEKEEKYQNGNLMLNRDGAGEKRRK